MRCRLKKSTRTLVVFVLLTFAIHKALRGTWVRLLPLVHFFTTPFSDVDFDFDFDSSHPSAVCLKWFPSLGSALALSLPFTTVCMAEAQSRAV